MQIEKKICIPTSRCSSSMSCIGKHFPAGEGWGRLSCNLAAAWYSAVPLRSARSQNFLSATHTKEHRTRRIFPHRTFYFLVKSLNLTASRSEHNVTALITCMYGLQRSTCQSKVRAGSKSFVVRALHALIVVLDPLLVLLLGRLSVYVPAYNSR